MKKILPNTILFLCILTAIRCSTPDINKAFARPGHFRLYSYPDLKKEVLPPNIKRLVIAGTNDIHGNINPVKEFYTNSSGERRSHYVGGAEVLSSYINILRKQYPEEVLLLDAGDMYQGTLISNYFQGEPVVKMFNAIRYDATTLGNHEFDFGPRNKNRMISLPEDDPQGALKANIRKSTVPYVVSNIIDTRTRKNIRWGGVEPYLLREINGLKVGIIGTTTLETPDKTIAENVRGLYFKNIATTALKYSTLLRKKGADIIVMVTHSGFECGRQYHKELPIPVEKLNFDVNKNDLCDKNGELYKVLNSIPPGTLDAVVAGHTHSKISNFVEDIPIIQSFGNGTHLGRLELYYDINKGSLVKDKTIIYQPTKLCHEFFDNTDDCYSKDKTVTYNNLKKATFLGLPVDPDLAMTKVLGPYRNKIEEIAQKKIARLEEPLIFERHKEAVLGVFIADAIRKSMNVNIAMTNAGGIRGDLPAGDISYEDLYRSVPFDNHLVKMELSGKQIKELAAIATSGQEAGIGYFSGLKILVNAKFDERSKRDLNGDQIKEKWERDRVIQVKLEDGSEIEDAKSYSFATNTFVAISGGDNYHYVMSQIPENKKSIQYDRTYRDAVVDYLQWHAKENKKINSSQFPYYTKENQRIILVK